MRAKGARFITCPLCHRLVQAAAMPRHQRSEKCKGSDFDRRVTKEDPTT